MFAQDGQSRVEAEQGQGVGCVKRANGEGFFNLANKAVPGKVPVVINGVSRIINATDRIGCLPIGLAVGD